MKMKLSILLLLSLPNNILLGSDILLGSESVIGSGPGRGNVARLRVELEAKLKQAPEFKSSTPRKQLQAAESQSAASSARADLAGEDFDDLLRRTQSESQSEPNNDRLGRGVLNASVRQGSKLSRFDAVMPSAQKGSRNVYNTERLPLIKEGVAQPAAYATGMTESDGRRFDLAAIIAQYKPERQVASNQAANFELSLEDIQAVKDLARLSPDEIEFSKLATMKKVMPGITLSQAAKLSENPAELRKFKDLLDKHFNPGVVSNPKTYWSDVKTWLESSSAKIKQGIKKLIKEANNFYESKIRSKYFNRVVAPNAKAPQSSVMVEMKTIDAKNDEGADILAANEKEVVKLPTKKEVKPPVATLSRKPASQDFRAKVEALELLFEGKPKPVLKKPVLNVSSNIKAQQEALLMAGQKHKFKGDGAFGQFVRNQGQSQSAKLTINKTPAIKKAPVVTVNPLKGYGRF